MAYNCLMTAVVEKRIVRFAWIVPTVFYASTMSHTMGYVDAALVLRNAYFWSLSAWVNNHGLFSLLGWLWMKALPFGTEFFRLNLLSMLFGAATTYFIFLACREYTKRLWISSAVAFALMTSHSLWWHSTMIEVYTLNTLLLALIFFSIARYYSNGRKGWLYTALLFWGLGVSNHILMALLAPTFVLLVIFERRSLTARDVLVGIACLLAGLAIFLAGFIRSYLLHRSLGMVLNLVTGGEFRSLMFHGGSRLFWLLNFLFLIVYQYPSLAIAYLAYGLVFLAVRPNRFDLLVISALVPFSVWAAGYHVWDMYAFSLPVYVLLTFPIAKGLLLLRERRRLAFALVVSLAIPPLLYPILPASRLTRDYASRYAKYATVATMFDPARYFMNPVKTEFDDVESYAGTLFADLPSGSWYYDNVFDYPIRYYYQDVRGRRPDLHCPIVFAFWVDEREISSVSRSINREVSRGAPVFVSRFVFDTVGPRLVYARSESVTVNGRTLYRLY